MVKKTNHKDALFWSLEEYGPYILGLVGATIMAYCSIQDMVNGEVLEKILDSTIVFGSIIIGFVGVLLGILFTIRNTKLISLLFNTWGKNKLKSFFKQNIVAGFILVLITMMLYIRGGIDGLLEIKYCIKPSVILFAIWGFLLVFTLTSTYRTINVMMHIIFSDDRMESEEPAPVVMEDESKMKLKEKYGVRIRK